MNFHAISEYFPTFVTGVWLTLELLVALGWRNAWTRIPAVLFFSYRVIGVVCFEVSDLRIFLFIFPNMFENWWLYCAVVMKWFPRAASHNDGLARRRRQTMVRPASAWRGDL